MTCSRKLLLKSGLRETDDLNVWSVDANMSDKSQITGDSPF